MKYKQLCEFDRDEYLKAKDLFEAGKIEDVTKELCEFDCHAASIAQELAYTRYALARLEEKVSNLIREEWSVSCPDNIDVICEYFGWE